MKQFKFKAKDVQFGEWKYGHLNLTESGRYTIRYGGNDWIVDPNTICQSTGLRSKDGIEIYEGDYLRFFGKLSTTVKEVELCVQVVWDERRLLFGYKDIIGNQTQDVQKTGLLIAMEPHKWTVVGNIHDKDD